MSQPRHLSAPAYLVAFALITLPLLDAFLQVLPIRLHDPRWRFGTFGFMSNALLIPLLGLLVALTAAASFDHRRFQRVIGILSFLAALIVLGLLGVFGLDSLQVRGQVKAPAQFAFNVASITATVKSLMSIVGLTTLGVAGFRGPKFQREHKPPGASGLIMGAKAGPGGSLTGHRNTPSSTSTS